MSDETHDRPLTDVEAERALREQVKRMRVADLAYEMMVTYVTLGYQKLGLTEQTRELRDLDDAHLAIELLRATLGVVEQGAGKEPFKDLRATLAQMQLGYAQVLQGVAAESAAEAPAEPTETAAESMEQATDESAGDGAGGDSA
ncbi:MAG: hypothetical protein R2826_02635 [Thermoleophilia bacterium]